MTDYNKDNTEEHIIDESISEKEELNKNSNYRCFNPNEECKKLIINVPPNLKNKSSINVKNFEDVFSIKIVKSKLIEEVNKYFTHFICLINGTEKEKEIILSKSIEIFKNYISRAENNEFTIRKTVNARNVAISIIYAATRRMEVMSKITMEYLSSISGISPANIGRHYNKYFGHLHPRNLYYPHGFSNIRNIFSLYFFEKMKDNKVELSKIVLTLQDRILKNDIDLSKNLEKKDFNKLYKMVSQDPNNFSKYFSDLGEVIKQLIISSKIHKKIGATLVIRPLTDFLENNDINLFQTSENFYKSVMDIVNYLKKSEYANFFPIHLNTPKNLSKNQIKYNRAISRDYRKIIGSKLKLYVIKNIYNGKYSEDGYGQCPECLKEGKNTKISRLRALEFHHRTESKEVAFNENYFYHLFSENRANPNFLEDMISLMESEKLILVCRNHHKVLFHNKYYRYFRHLINWKNLFYLPAEVIHILIRTSVDNFSKTKNRSKEEKNDIRKYIKRKLRKKYIIENYYGDVCPTCKEFSIKGFLPAFIGHHLDEKTKTVRFAKIYDLPCSEIAHIIKKERGGYICANCHTVIHNKYIHLFEKIYEDKNIAKNVLEDYNHVNSGFTPFQFIGNIKDPLKTSIRMHGSFEKYLTAIFEISKFGYEVTTTSLMKYLGIKDNATILNFFKKNSSFINSNVDIISGKAYNPTVFNLTSKGKELIKLIYYFKDYYQSLKIA